MSHDQPEDLGTRSLGDRASYGALASPLCRIKVVTLGQAVKEGLRCSTDPVGVTLPACRLLVPDTS